MRHNRPNRLKKEGIIAGAGKIMIAEVKLSIHQATIS